MFSRRVLALDESKAIDEITHAISTQLASLHKRGAVVAISGGIDSALVAALCQRALGSERVLGLFLPERASSAQSMELGEKLARALSIATVTANISPALEALGCYRAQDEAVRSVFPGYGPGWKFKITLPSILISNRLNVFFLTVQSPHGEILTERLPLNAYLQLVAATNYKQRARKMTEYFHADRLNYAVAGTPNRLEYDQGFFVKQGDGAADFKPIAHLYKSQVYALAKALDVPDEIRLRAPTTDTYSLEQSQEEFYFALPYALMDLALWAHDHDVPAPDTARVLELTPQQVERIFRDIESKRRYASYLHSPALLVPQQGEL